MVFGLGRPTWPSSMRGALLMVAAGAAYALSDAATKFALSESSYGLAVFVRGFCCCAAIFLVAATRQRLGELSWTNCKGQVVCAIYYVLSVFLFTVALPYLSLPLAITAYFTGPLFVLLLAPVFLRERLTTFRIAAAVIGFCGVALAARQRDILFTWAILLPIGSAFCTAMRDVTLARLLRTEKPFSLLFSQQAGLTLFGLLVTILEPASQSRPSDLTYGILVAGGLTLLVGIYCMIEAFRASDIIAVSALRYLSILWGGILGVIIWHDQFVPLQLVGMLIVLCNGVGIALVESRRKV